MLVPAMAFAWWLVSMSANAPHSGGVRDEIKPTAKASMETPAQDTEDEAAPADPVTDNTDNDGTEESDQTAGERVPLKVVTSEIVRAAKTYLDFPMGSEHTASLSGRRYVFVLERHYHPPGFVGGPHGWHKGVTVYGLR